uniref:Uncharacterized protein n=2 Tax=Alexandrium monilatum TaxID=311494 RepID=A0A7S4QNW3_9DINO
MATERMSELQLLKLKTRQLEEEAKNRTELAEAEICHREAVQKSFASRCFATAVAWATSELVFSCAELLADPSAKHGQAQEVSLGTQFWCRLAYAAVCYAICPYIIWILRPSGGQTDGNGFFADFLKLVAGCAPMILSWSIMDAWVALMNWAGNARWDDLIAAAVLTIVMSVTEMLPLYKWAKAGVDAGGEEDKLFKRYLVFPTYSTLAAGRLWNDFFNWPITEINKEVAGKPNIIFLIQLVFYILLSSSIIYATAWWSKKSTHLAKEFGKGDEEHHTQSAEHHALDMEKSMGAYFVSCLSYVYAWGLSNTLNAFFFNLMFGCSGASSCGYATNCLYAIVLTVVFTFYAASMTYQNRQRPWGKAHQALMILSMSLCVGWAWKGYFNSTISAFAAESGFGRVTCYIVLTISLWIFAGLFWHLFLKERRRAKYFRQQALRGTKVDPSTMTVAADDPASLHSI